MLCFALGCLFWTSFVAESRDPVMCIMWQYEALKRGLVLYLCAVVVPPGRRHLCGSRCIELALDCERYKSNRS